jgi:hypothetical protein
MNVTYQQSRPIAKNKIEAIPARCGLIALEKREIQLITHEKPLSINFSLTNWETLFGVLGTILAKWDTLSATRNNIKTYAARIKKLRTENDENIQPYVTLLEDKTTSISSKFDAADKAFKITFEPHRLAYDSILPRINTMATINTDDSFAISTADFDLIAEILTLFKLIRTPQQFIHSFIPDLTAALFALATDSECLLTSAHAVEWAAIIIQERLADNQLRFPFPCLPAAKLFQEYHLVSFPTILDGAWMRSTITETVYMLADNNNTIYSSNPAALRLYDDDLTNIALYTLDTVSQTAITQFAESLFKNPYKHNNVPCPDMTPISHDLTELVTLGTNKILYFSNYVEESMKNVLHFVCADQPIEQKINPGLSLITVDTSCVFHHPADTQIPAIDFIEDTTDVFYIPESAGTLKKVEKKGFQITEDDSSTTIRANKVIVYVVLCLIIIGLLSVAKFNISAIYKFGRQFQTLYTQFRNNPVAAEVPPAAAVKTTNRNQMLAPFIM